jgi:hypothetical protein
MSSSSRPQGNALFIVESIRAAVRRAFGCSVPSLQAVIGARLRQLSEPARDLVGRRRHDRPRLHRRSWFASVSNVDDVTLVRGLDELWRRGIIP